MWVMEQALSPGVQHGDHAGLGAEVLRIGGDGAHCLRRRLEQDVIDDRLVLQGHGGERRGHSEHDVEVRHRQQLGLPVGEPLHPGQVLALGAVVVAIRIVDEADLTAVGALFDMATERWRAASLDGGHDPPLPVGQRGGVFGVKGGTMVAEDVRHLQRGPHGEGSAGRRHRDAKAIQRVGRVDDQMGDDLGVTRRGRQPGMAKQRLDDADVGVALQQMGGKAVPQRRGSDRFCRIVPEEQLLGWPRRSPVGPQDL